MADATLAREMGKMTLRGSEGVTAESANPARTEKKLVEITFRHMVREVQQDSGEVDPDTGDAIMETVEESFVACIVTYLVPEGEEEFRHHTERMKAKDVFTTPQLQALKNKVLATDAPII